MMRTPRGFTRLTLAIAMLAMLVGACAGGGVSEEMNGDFDTISADLGGVTGVESSQERGAFAGPTSDEQASSSATSDDADKSLGDGGTDPAIVPIDNGRDIIYTADVSVAVIDVAAATRKATQSIQALGGMVFGQESVGGPEPYSTLTFKVMPADFQLALQRLGELGELRNQNVSADDVTERVVDLQSRIATAEASVARLRELLAAAADINNVVALENQLLERETQLETLRGQLRTIEGRVAYATINLTIALATTRPAVRVDVTIYPGHDDGSGCPGSGGFTFERGAQATVCFEIVNVGDTLLTGFTLRDPILDLDLNDLIPVLGSPGDTLEPGRSIMLAGEIDTVRRLRTQTNVTAQPVDEDGNSLGRETANTASIEIAVVDPVGIPGFGEGLGSSWQLLVDLAKWIILAVGALIPFAWIPAAAYWWYRRAKARSVDRQAHTEV